MDGIELQDREFIAAINEGREPNASVDQVLACYEVLDRLDQQSGAECPSSRRAPRRSESSAAQGERYEPAVGFVITGVMAAGKSTVAELLAQELRARRARARRRLSQDDRQRSRPDHARAR